MTTTDTLTVACARPGCKQTLEADRRHWANLSGRWRCADHDRKEVPC